MKAKEWLEVIKQAKDYNHSMTPLIEKYGEMLIDEYKLANKNFVQPAVMRSAFAVIPDAERLDIGSNKIIAVFQHRHQAEEWAKSMWEKFYLIEEVKSEHLS